MAHDFEYFIHEAFSDRYTTNETFHEFLNRATLGYDYIMIEWCGMWLGIETDGHAHS